MFILSCQKQINENKQYYLDNIKVSLKKSMPIELYRNLDFTNTFLSRVDSQNLLILRVPFQGKKIENDFVVIKTNLSGIIETGRIIHMEGSSIEFGKGKNKNRHFNGKILINSLTNNTILQSNIKGGYFQIFHPNNYLNKNQVLPSNDVLPEVVVVAYVSTSSPISYSDWTSLGSYFYDPGTPGGGSTGTYYTPVSGSDGYLGSTPVPTPNNNTPITSSGNENVKPAPVFIIKLETYVNHPAIDLLAYLKCFDDVSGDKATCSVEIYSDLPVNGDPTKIFDWKTESPGHCFLQIKKANGIKSITQNIGFYPNTNWKNILSATPVDSKFVDDGNHEFDASLKMNINTYQMKMLLQKIKDLVKNGIKYDMDEFNCTDFALQTFNSVRLQPLNIAKIDIPGGIALNGSNTPQGLYITLQQMKNNHDAEAGNITIGNSYNWVNSSSGPCY
ncbi:MAG: hypothetical protein NVSMB67_25120 [Flavisolibacter sp.]